MHATPIEFYCMQFSDYLSKKEHAQH